MSSNLTKAGWLLLVVSLIVLSLAWYVARFVFNHRFSTIQFFVVSGFAIIGGGAWVLGRLGYDIIK